MKPASGSGLARTRERRALDVTGNNYDNTLKYNGIFQHVASN
jgi:hypothetical protein